MVVTTRNVTRDRATWPLLLALGLLVVAPSVCIIWFMTAAAANETAAARLRLSESRRGQLQLLRDRIDAGWQARLADLRAMMDGGALAFHRAVSAGTVDSIVIVGEDGSPVYPSLTASGSPDAEAQDPAWRAAATMESSGDFRAAAQAYAALAGSAGDSTRAARAAQAHVRTLVQARDADEALRAIERHFASGPLAAGRDPYGRLIAADAHLLALRLLPAGDRRIDGVTNRLVTLLNDYESTPLPSTQRLFLMEELRQIAGPDLALATYAAERLAADFLEMDGIAPPGDALEAARVEDVWKLRVPGAPAIALLRTDTIAAIADAVLETQEGAAGVRFSVVPPGGDSASETMALSPLLPGWLIGFTPSETELTETTAGRRMALYLWAGSLAVAGLALAGLLLWQAFRRQLRLNRLKTDLVAAVSHELKTPLASMRALVDLMLEDPGFDRASAREYLQMMAGENERLTRLIEHFLTFSRIDGSAQHLELRDVQPAALVSQAIAIAPGHERFPGLVTEVAPDLPPLYGDEEALVTVLLNLLENAYKYSDANRRVCLRVRDDAGSVLFEVEDNGIGISRRDRKRIFRPFYRVDQRLARERGGCGLGLSIVEFLVRAHGGEVTVRSEPGAGSVFTVALPSRTAAREAVA